MVYGQFYKHRTGRLLSRHPLEAAGKLARRDRRNSALTFVTPPVNGWVCVVGEPTMHRNGNPSIEAISKTIANLSDTFREAQAFASYRAIEYHH